MRLLRRLGGALRGAIARLRRPAQPASNPQPHPTENLEAPTPSKRQRAPRRPETAAPARPGWLASWFGLRPRHAVSRHQPPPGDDSPYSPQTHPGIPQEICDILNTPIDQLDPDLACLVLAALAKAIADSVPFESELSDPRAVFAALWGGMADRLGHAAPAAAPEPPETAPAEQTAPAAPRDAVPDAPPPPPGEPRHTRAPVLPEQAATATIAAAAAAPETTVLSRPDLPIAGVARSRLRRQLGRHCLYFRHSFLPRGLCRLRNYLPPPRWRLYDACAGPP